MAAGAGTRFGPDKLLVEFRGKPLIQWALEAIPADRLCRVAVVTGDQRIRTMAEGFGFSPVWNDRPELGVSRTIRLGLEALAPICDGVIFQVADQPLLRRETVASLAETWLANPEQIIVPAAGGCWGNPCVFPKDLFPVHVDQQPVDGLEPQGLVVEVHQLHHGEPGGVILPLFFRQRFFHIRDNLSDCLGFIIARYQNRKLVHRQILSNPFPSHT